MIQYTPAHFHDLFGLKLPVEAVAMTVGFILMSYYIVVHLKKLGLPKSVLSPKIIARFIIVVILSALAGGRLWSFIANWQGIRGFLLIFDLTRPGLVSVGMIVGGIVGVFLFFAVYRKHDKFFHRRILFARFVDVLAPAVALWIFIFRLFGCSLNGDVVGVPTDLPWALHWTASGVSRHPTSFYLAFSGLLIFFLLRFLLGYEKREDTKFGKRFDGEVILWFLFLYFFNRFWIDFFRVTSDMYGQFDVVQIVCIPAFIGFGLRLVHRYWVIKDVSPHTLKKCNRKIFVGK